MIRLLAERNARLYLLGQALSTLGDNALWLAGAVWVKTLTGSNSAAALVFFAFGLPQIAAPIWGIVVDRLSRRRLLVVVDLASAVVVLALLAVDGAGRVWLVYAVMLLYGVSSSMIGAGQTALIPEMLPDELLPRMNGALRALQEGVRLVAPLAGVGAFTAFGMTAVVVADAATFVVAAALTALLRPRETEADRSPRDPWSEITAGVRHIAGVPVLRRVVLATAVAFLTVGFAEAIVFPVLEHGLGRPPAFLGVLVTFQGVGAIAGGAAAAGAVERIGEARTAGLGMALFALGIGLLAAPNLLLVTGGMAVLGSGIPWLAVGVTTLIQRRTPAALLGRAAAALQLLTGAPNVLSVAAGAALVAVVDYRVLIGAIVAVVGACAAYVVIRAGTPRGTPVPPPAVTSPVSGPDRRG